MNFIFDTRIFDERAVRLVVSSLDRTAKSNRNLRLIRVERLHLPLNIICYYERSDHHVVEEGLPLNLPQLA
jgi:hypothetical protein